MSPYIVHLNCSSISEFSDQFSGKYNAFSQEIETEKANAGTKPYNAFNQMCAIRDRLRDASSYLNGMMLTPHPTNTAVEFMHFLFHAAIICDGVEQLARIFGCKAALEKIRGLQNIFHLDQVRESDASRFEPENGFCPECDVYKTDKSFFEYIRSLGAMHPSNTSHHENYHGKDTFHTSPYVRWNDFGDRHLYELYVIVYPGSKSDESHRVYLKINEFVVYAQKHLDFIREITSRLADKQKKLIERHKNTPIKKPDEHSSCTEYLGTIKSEMAKRKLWRNNEGVIDLILPFFTTKILSSTNFTLLICYQNAIKYAITMLHEQLQDMGEDEKRFFIIELTQHRPQTLDHRTWAHPSEHLNDLIDVNCPRSSKDFVRRELCHPQIQQWIKKFVEYTGEETDEELYTLVNLACYLDNLSGDSKINKVIPRDSLYRPKFSCQQKHLAQEHSFTPFFEDDIAEQTPTKGIAEPDIMNTLEKMK